MKYVFTIFSAFVLISCGTLAQSEKSVATTTSNEEKIIFLTYHIKKTTASNSEIVFVKKSIAKGRIKGFHKQKQLDKAGNLECTLLDKDYKPLETLFISNPLERIIEFVNDSGNLGKRLVLLDKTDFVIRMPYHDKAIYVRIQEITNSDTQNYIFTKL